MKKSAFLNNKDQIRQICRANDISYLGLFGSYSRGEAHKSSDVDLLLDFKKTKSFFELARLKYKLEGQLGKSVDLVIRKNIKTRIKPFILRDLKTLYAER
ncbi:MAG: DNA polymerase subunit beta [Parcubacteria group bacterium Gr01-1014_18]|nr:MAG: DNA polymerase subunit beta [Parcubacteria group bacterium Greene0416_36]TSC80239.1 MAG: DNA polymerase subunit beta [Parcubacteria group bacterium Gr01-1014_18]TSC98421.1 MAG: DNA polymerase subunit beta [Parcubacteria group bacterium Greene1014_20]TSD06962.1 MAG: DNA polymerase subunit beta [Parcubacteria group bacterium Greene0714_2]